MEEEEDENEGVTCIGDVVGKDGGAYVGNGGHRIMTVLFMSVMWAAMMMMMVLVYGGEYC